MSLIVLDKATLSFGPQPVLRDVNLRIGEGDKIGLMGANGTGKSTLLKVMVDQQALDAGTVTRARGCRIGYLPQDILDNRSGTVLGTVLAAVPGRAELKDKLIETEQELDASEDPDEQMRLASQLAELAERLEHFELFYDEHQAMRIIKGLGFSDDEHQRPLAELSGGWKMRVALAGLLFQQPDVLLMDEPTNHLDLPSVIWLDRFLESYRNSVVLICHDRQFFNKHCQRVISFEAEGLRVYRGDYDDYLRQRSAEEEVLAASTRKRERKVKEMERFVERFRAQATKARQAQSRVKQIERMQRNIEAPIPQTRHLSFSFPQTERTGRDVLLIEKLSKAFGDNRLYDGLTRGIYAGDRVAIVGENGAGKSTLLKMMAGELQPDAGEIRAGANVKIGYFAQHHTELLSMRRTVLQEVWAQKPDAGESRARGVCGAFLFSGDDVDKPIGILSGGERARVLLARLLINPGNVLLLDEPTTHLDMAAAEALAMALDGYDGTLVLVSHNTTLLNLLPTRLWDINRGKLTEYPGTLAEYMEHQRVQAALEEERLARSKEKGKGKGKGRGEGRGVREGKGKGKGAGKGKGKEGKGAGKGKGKGKEGESAAAERESAQKRKARKREEANRRNRLGRKTKQVCQQIEELEAKIEQVEDEQADLEPLMEDPALYQDAERSRKVVSAYDDNKRKLESLFWKWEELQEELESIKARFTGIGKE